MVTLRNATYKKENEVIKWKHHVHLLSFMHGVSAKLYAVVCNHFANIQGT